MRIAIAAGGTAGGAGAAPPRARAPRGRGGRGAVPRGGRGGERYLVPARPTPAGTGTADRAASRRRLELPADGPCLLVFGGSIGARTINLAAVEAFGREAPCPVLHASGRRDHAELRGLLEELGSPSHYRLFEYVQPFADALAAADLAVARPGR